MTMSMSGSPAGIAVPGNGLLFYAGMNDQFQFTKVPKLGLKAAPFKGAASFCGRKGLDPLRKERSVELIPISA